MSGGRRSCDRCQDAICRLLPAPTSPGKKTETNLLRQFFLMPDGAFDLELLPAVVLLDVQRCEQNPDYGRDAVAEA